MAKKSKISNTFLDYQDKQANNLNQSLEESAELSRSFLGPMLVILLIIVVLFSSYWAFSRISAKPLKIKLNEIASYVENNKPSWQSIRMLGYQQEAEIITYGYYYNSYFSSVDIDSLIQDGVNLGQWAEDNKGKLFGRVVIGLTGNDFVFDLSGNNYESRFTTILRVNGESIPCVSFYGLTYLISDPQVYNPYSELGNVYIPAHFISNPDDYAFSNIPVYQLTGELVSPTYNESNSLISTIDSIFSGFKLIGDVALTGFEFIEFCLGFVWVLFT